MPRADEAIKSTRSSPSQYFLSPQTLRMTGCRCIESRDPPQTAIATIDYMIRRLDKLWSRMQASRLDPKVKIAAERVLLSLRKEGLDLFHLVGRNMGGHQQGNKHRDQLSIMFLIPGSTGHHHVTSERTTEVSDVSDNNDVSESSEDGHVEDDVDEEPDYCHQIVAELSVFIYTNGRQKGQVERVDTRQRHDWTDVTSLADRTYYRVDDAPPPIPIQSPADGSDVTQAIWAQVTHVMGGAWNGLHVEFGRRLEKAITELRMDGLRIRGFEVEKVLKKAEGEKFVPTARVTIEVFGRSENTEGDSPPPTGRHDGKAQEGSKALVIGDDEKDEAGLKTSNGAVILVEGRAGDLTKIKHILVIYEGEAPVVHRYRNKAEPPSLPGLAELMTV